MESVSINRSNYTSSCSGRMVQRDSTPTTAIFPVYKLPLPNPPACLGRSDPRRTRIYTHETFKKTRKE